MKKLLKVIVYVLAVLVVLAGTAYFFRAKIAKHFIPTVEQTGEIQIDVRNDTAYVSSKLIVTNNSFIKIELDTLRYSVTLFDKTYLKSMKYIGMILNPYKGDSLDFSLKIPYAAILKDLAIQRTLGDSANYSINIYIQYSTLFGRDEIPIKKTAKLKIPQPPELDIVNINYKKVRMKHILANVQVKIMNYNSMALSIKDMAYSMNIGKQGNVKGKYKREILIQPNGETYIDLPIEITAKNIGKTFFDVLFDNDNYNYRLNINATLESIDPVKKTFQLDVTKDGRMELKK